MMTFVELCDRFMVEYLGAAPENYDPKFVAATVKLARAAYMRGGIDMSRMIAGEMMASQDEPTRQGLLERIAEIQAECDQEVRELRKMT